jgi:hypothetical protein
MDKYSIVKLKLKGISNREVSRLTGVDRKTVSKYWIDYTTNMESLKEEDYIEVIQERIINTPSYNSSNRQPRKYTKEIDMLVDDILIAEDEKNKLLGRNKQYLTQCQIHEIVISKGYDIGRTTIATQVRLKKKKYRECFIKQSYNFGDRLEYDFGEVKLVINELVTHYYIAVFSSPASNFRWAYLYKKADKEVFMDSHVKFFEMVIGVYKEVVYDNMRNVVTKFIGRTEKLLNKDLISMSLYYGFEINVTNCFSGNEKGHVEGSVKTIRNKVFSKVYKFNSEEDAKNHLELELKEMNQTSLINEEIKYLLDYKPKLELAKITINIVNKYSFIRVENNFYSVPDYLVGLEVNVHNYIDRVVIYRNKSLVCEHKKIDGFNLVNIDISHYLHTLLKKPGALKNSSALKNKPKLKAIYDKYFITNPKYFIQILLDNQDTEFDDLIMILETMVNDKFFNPNIKNEISSNDDIINNLTRNQISKISEIYHIKGVN